jgi:hypothetical protein
MWWRLFAARMAIQFRGAETVRSLLFEPHITSAAIETPPWIPRFLAMASSYPIGISCLPRSLALRNMLRNRGVAASVRIGVRAGDRPGGPRLDGHAWVEVGGKVVGDDPQHVARYAPYEIANERAPLNRVDFEYH